jgi:hypothetical protein
MPGKTLQEMVDLLEQNNQFSQIIPDELMIAIFWEETMFQNIEQFQGLNGQVGLGFGQVQEDSLPLIKVRLHKVFTRGLITQNENIAVEVACCYMETLRRGFKSGSVESAYKSGYAKATPDLRNQVLDPRTGRTRGQIADAVWQASLDLIACKSWDEKAAVKAALMKARAASDDDFKRVLG